MTFLHFLLFYVRAIPTQHQLQTVTVLKDIIAMRTCSYKFSFHNPPPTPPPPPPSPLKPTTVITAAFSACDWQPHSSATPDGVMAGSEPRESTAGERSIEGALITSNHPPGREACHIFISVAMKTISDDHQHITPTASAVDWLLDAVILWAAAGDGKEQLKKCIK